MERENAWKKYDGKALEELEGISARYRKFLDNGKTERECADYAIELAKKNGYESLEDAIKGGWKLRPGTKLWSAPMGKTIMLFIIGSEPLVNGMNIVGAHIDSPRMDLKQNPLYEDSDLVYLDTHYYGGIKKYQWVARELALHGVVVKKDGTTVQICIGEKEDDPVVGVSDLLIHLSQEQMAKKLSEAITGEDLDIILGGDRRIDDIGIQVFHQSVKTSRKHGHLVDLVIDDFTIKPGLGGIGIAVTGHRSHGLASLLAGDRLIAFSGSDAPFLVHSLGAGPRLLRRFTGHSFLAHGRHSGHQGQHQ